MRSHDYTQPRWGHSVEIIQTDDDRMTAQVVGFGHGVRAGDYLLLANGLQSTRYQIMKLQYGSPPDCWSADVAFSPRPE